jgi:hypothetical protein
MAGHVMGVSHAKKRYDIHSYRLKASGGRRRWKRGLRITVDDCGATAVEDTKSQFAYCPRADELALGGGRSITARAAACDAAP